MSYGVRKVVGSITAEGDAYWAAAMRRTYFEQRDLRSFLTEALALSACPRPLTAVEFGCGYGRMLPVVGEFAINVIGVERDPELAGIAASGHPWYRICPVKVLSEVPLADASAELIVTYTVLQHLTDEECKQTVSEMKRILDPTGIIVICEDTGDFSGPDYFQRTVSKYQDLFGMRLLKTLPRRFEDGRIVGQHIAFRW